MKSCWEVSMVQHFSTYIEREHLKIVPCLKIFTVTPQLKI
jgi:hypothetical protein